MVEMASAFISGFSQVFAWPTFGLMLVGIAIGFVVGILPGLGGPTTLARCYRSSSRCRRLRLLRFSWGWRR